MPGVNEGRGEKRNAASATSVRSDGPGVASQPEGGDISWRQYWSSRTSLLASERLKAVHDREIADSILEHLPFEGARVLDFGCGEAQNVEQIASRCARLYLCDASDAVRAHLGTNYAGVEGVSVIAPEEIKNIDPGSIDQIVACSVMQYLSPAELSDFLNESRRLLSKAGSLVIADIIPPDVGALADTLDLVKFGWRNGVLSDVGLHLFRTAFSGYTGVRARLGLAKYSEAEFLDILRRHGFQAHRLPRNFGHSQNRMAFAARA